MISEHYRKQLQSPGNDRVNVTKPLSGFQPFFHRLMPGLGIAVVLGSLTLGSISCSRRELQSEAVYPVGSAKQLFIDDLLISSSENVTLSMNPPLKTYEQNIIPDRPWEEFSLSSHNTFLEDKGIYKAWYGAHRFEAGGDQPDDLDGEALHTYVYKHLRQYVCYATSRDGVQWEKPELGGIEFHGSRQNNIVLTKTYGTVFLDPGKPDGSRYKYAGRINGGFALWLWTSADGLRWSQFLDRPILSRGPFDSQNQVFWDDRIGKYVAYVRRGGDRINRAKLAEIPYSQVFELAADADNLRKIGRAESADLADWPEHPEVVLAYDDEDPVESDHYNPCVIKYPYAPDVYLMFPSAFLHTSKEETGSDGALDIQLATSRDGIHWDRRERRPYVRLGIEGSMDGGALYMSVGMLRRGPELWMYYTGYRQRHGGFDFTKTKRMGVVSRLKQRLDGFVSADAGFSGGQLTTVPLLFQGSQLILNLDTGALGSARVEILDGQGRVVPGFGREDSDPINGNYVERVVSWKGERDLSSLAGEPIRLRFIMRSTKLFAFQFTGAGVQG